MEYSFFNSQDFCNAVNDYFFLIDKAYPQKGVLSLIGDRYKLTGVQRILLYRGIFPESENEKRSQKLVTGIEGKILIIDGYNVIFTILNYWLGRLVFIGTDNFCRDVGSLFGKIRKQKQFETGLGFLIEFIKHIKPEYIEVYFDSPVSFSREHKHLTEQYIANAGIQGSVFVVKSADSALKQKNEGIICSSDSAIINESIQKVADLARHTIQWKFNPELIDVKNFIT